LILFPLRRIYNCGHAGANGRRVECVAESGYVDKGKKVKVIDVEHRRLTVRVVEESQ
jgi:membrane-bound ClpP family serine protease